MINEQGEGMITKHEVDQQAAAEIVEKQVEGSKNERRIGEKRITVTVTLKQQKRRL